MKFNPHNKRLLMLSAIETYYTSIGVHPDDSRKADQVKARNAIGVALLHWADTQQEVAEVLGRDRSTIAHMMINHSDNLEYWKGYKDMYETATMIVNNRLSASSKADKLASLTNKIYMLEKEAALLRNELNSIPTPVQR
jgi:predicted XRE-type DNA-binding protein